MSSNDYYYKRYDDEQTIQIVISYLSNPKITIRSKDKYGAMLSCEDLNQDIMICTNYHGPLSVYHDNGYDYIEYDTKLKRFGCLIGLLRSKLPEFYKWWKYLNTVGKR